jgi:Calpain family cysteine protease
VSAVGQTNPGATYQTSSEPLFGIGNAPSYLDVNQGYLGDCYFLASLGEVALQDPLAIEHMIHEHPNGTYGVRFIVNGQAEFITVNDQLPTLPGNYQFANGSHLEFANGPVAWAELIEKAFAQLNAEPNAPHGAQLNVASNAYDGIVAGNGTALTLLTGQSVSADYLSPATPLATVAVQIANAWTGTQSIVVGTPNIDNGNLVASHMFEVIGYDSATQTLTLHNPWGSGYSGSLAMTFTETLSALARDSCAIYATGGTPLSDHPFHL